jgi:hypothetical protein
MSVSKVWRGLLAINTFAALFTGSPSLARFSAARYRCFTLRSCATAAHSRRAAEIVDGCQPLR